MQGLAELCPGYVEGLGQNAGFGGDGHEVGITTPSREGVEVDVVGDSGSGGLAEVHAEVDAVGMVDLAEAAFDLLGGEDHLLRGFGRKCGEGVDVQVGQDEHVASAIWVGIEADKAVRAAMDDVGGLLGCLPGHAVGNGVVGGGDHVAEDTVLIFGGGPGGEGGRDASAGLFVGAGDVVVAPGGPETVHRSQYKVKFRRIMGRQSPKIGDCVSWLLGVWQNPLMGIQLRDFDMKALQAALETERCARDLTWIALAVEINKPFEGTPSIPISVTTLRGMHAKRSVTSAVVLQILRWLDRTPESFLSGRKAAPLLGETLPGGGPARILRFDTVAMHAALNAERTRRGMTWKQVAKELPGFRENMLTNLATGPLIGFPRAMMIPQWLGLPAANFVRECSR